MSKETYAASPKTFSASIIACMKKYFDFKGRASRSEYWWFHLFTILVQITASVVDPTELLAIVITLVFLAPLLSVGVRRLHDTGRSGWWLLLFLIGHLAGPSLMAFSFELGLVVSLVGLIWGIILLASAGEEKENKYDQVKAASK